MKVAKKSVSVLLEGELQPLVDSGLEMHTWFEIDSQILL